MKQQRQEPSNYAFIVGINEYQNVPSLQTPVNDAAKISELLNEIYQFNTRVLENAGKRQFLNFLEEIAGVVAEDDRVVFYFAGHGIATDSQRGIKGFVLPADADMKEEDSLISMAMLSEAFSRLPCRHFLLVLDCCFAGAFRWADAYRGIFFEGELFQQHYRYFTENPSWQVLTSAAHTQKALDFLGARDTDATGHSPFAACFIDGLKGQADKNGDRIITTTELFAFLQDRLTIITGEQGQVQNVGLFPLEKHQNGSFLFVPAGFDPSELRVKDYENPFKGLQAYDNSDAHVFFGREKAKKELLEKFNQHPLTVVVGASGMGKSSLIKAGLLPILSRQGLKIAEMRPGRDPMAEYFTILSDFDVLFIDQFEEMVTQAIPRRAAAFLNLLNEWVRSGETKLILSVRIDFEPQIDKTGIETAWEAGRYLIPSFMPEDLREVIVTPTARVGRFIDSEQLVNELVNEVVHFPGSLPLLSFTLSELFERCKNDPYRNIHYADYRELGGITGSLQKCADRVLQQLPAEHQKSLSRLMLRMIAFSGGEIVGKRVMLRDIQFNDPHETARMEELTNHLLAARLIVLNTDKNSRPFLEPAHDALVKAWATLYFWVKEFGEDNIYLLNKLGLAVDEYERIEEDNYLWSGNPSLESASQLPLNSREARFVAKSLKKQANEMKALKAERDEAVQQKLLAEKRLRAAENAALLDRIKNKNITLALRMALYNGNRHPDNDYFHHFYRDTIALPEVCFASDIIDKREAIKALAISPDGKKILLGMESRSELWDLEKRQLEKVFEEKYRRIDAVAFSPDGSKIVTSDILKPNAFLWNVKTCAVEQELTGHEMGISSVAFSADGTKILTGGMDKKAVLWDAATGRPEKTFEGGHTSFVRSVAFSPDGSAVLTGGADSQAVLWSMKTAKPRLFFAAGSDIQTVAFNLDDGTVFTGDSSGDVCHWEIKRIEFWEAFKVLQYKLGFFRTLFAWKKFRQLRQWNFKPKTSFQAHKGRISRLQYVSLGTILTSGEEDCAAYMWHVKDKSIQKKFIGHINSITAMDVSSDGRFMVTGGKDWRTMIWRLEDDTRGATDYRGHKESICAVAFNPTGDHFATGSYDTSAQYWEINRLKAKMILHVESESKDYKRRQLVASVAFTPDGKKLLVGSRFITATLWDLESRTIDKTLLGGFQDFLIIAFSPDGKYLLSAGHSKVAKLWDVATAALVRTFSGHFDEIVSVAFSPDGTKILTGSADHSVKLWDIAETLPRFTFEQHQGEVTALAFSPDGKKVLSGGKDKKVMLWDAKSAQVERVFSGHTNTILAVAFLNNGLEVLSAGKDKTVKKWQLSGDEVRTYLVPIGDVQCASFDTNHEKVVMGGHTLAVSMALVDRTPEEIAYRYSLAELREERMKLEPEDLQLLKAQGKELSVEESRQIGYVQKPPPNVD